MMESRGNLAYSLPRQLNNNTQRKIHTREYLKRHNAVPKRVVIDNVSEEYKRASLLHKQMARKRIGAIVTCIIIVMTLSAAFAGILYRSSKIMEMNYANVKIEREIDRLSKENDQLIEIMSKKTDLKIIRTSAIEKLGMQDPGQHQIVNVSIPVSDRVIIDSSVNKVSNDETQLSNAFNNIEGFFKTIR